MADGQEVERYYEVEVDATKPLPPGEATTEMSQYLEDNPPIRITQAEARVKSYLAQGELQTKQGNAVELVSSYSEFDKREIVKAHVELQTKQGYQVPIIVDIDTTLDPRVAVDLAIAEQMYQDYIHEMTASWEEMRPRIIRRFNRKYGIES